MIEISDEVRRGVPAGRVTTATLGVVAAAAAASVLVHRDLSTVAIAGAGLGLYAALCLMPLGTMDRAMRVSSLLATLMALTAAAIGGFTLTVTTWHPVGALCLAVAVLASCAAWAELPRLRHRPGWRASQGGDIGYWAEGRGSQR
ncbi:MAG TPA: hypothetical protein VN088_16580 [Nocardioides sp.]|nr:hypothetical protein [Nocardioides sp.]